MIYKTTWQCKHLKGQLDPLSVKWRFLIKRGQLDLFVGWFEGAKRNVENIPKLHSCPTIHSGFGLVFKIVTLHFLDDLAVAEIEIKFTFIPRCSICCEWQLKFGTKARDCNMNSYAVITGIWLKYQAFEVNLISNSSRKHRKNCECCPGHYLIVNHYSSI